MGVAFGNVVNVAPEECSPGATALLGRWQYLGSGFPGDFFRFGRFVAVLPHFSSKTATQMLFPYTGVFSGNLGNASYHRIGWVRERSSRPVGVQAGPDNDRKRLFRDSHGRA
jgi:hypothetical protein